LINGHAFNPCLYDDIEHFHLLRKYSLLRELKKLNSLKINDPMKK
jgi:hypothetical protein